MTYPDVPLALRQRAAEARAQNLAARRMYEEAPDDPLTVAAVEASSAETQAVLALLAEWTVPDDDFNADLDGVLAKGGD